MSFHYDGGHSTLIFLTRVAENRSVILKNGDSIASRNKLNKLVHYRRN